MSVTYISLPEEVPVGKPPVARIRELVDYAIEHALAPRRLPEGPARVRYPMRLAPAFEGRVRAHLERTVGTEGVSLPRQIGGLAWAAWRAQQGERIEQPAADSTPASGTGVFEGRPEQALFHARVREGLAAGGVVLGEAGTGVGKGRVLGALAAEFGAASREPAVIAAPSIQVLGQLLDEYLALPEPPAATFLLGRDQFVSSRALEAWLESEEASAQARERVRAWRRAGAGAAGGATARFHRHVPELAWLAEDLAAVDPEVPVDEMRLAFGAADEEDEGEGAYQGLRERAHAEVPVIFATHSMLVWDRILKQRSKDAGGGAGILPPVDAVLIDEAHQFAAVAEAVHSRQIAFRTLERELGDEPLWRAHRLVSAARRARAQVHGAMESLRESAELRGLEGKALDPAGIEALRPAMARVREALEPLSGGPSRIVNDAHGFARSILSASVRVHLSFSAVRRYPSLIGGPRSLQKFFTQLWESTPRAALVSATIYLPRTVGPSSYGLLKTSLHLPGHRLHTPPPVLPEWLFSPTLCVPGAGRQERLSPPQEKHYAERPEAFDAAERRWYDALGAQIAEIAGSARGGVLVLLTSYDSVEALSARLAEPIGERLVEQRRGGFRSALGRFVQAYEQDVKAVWLAAGPAWAGLDLSDRAREAAQDWLLTDVVIPRVPFGVERSATHLARAAWMKSAERDRAAFQMRQGMGRLMRRPGLMERRLWVLDGRIWMAEPAAAWLFQPVKALLRHYSRQMEIETDQP